MKHILTLAAAALTFGSAQAHAQAQAQKPLAFVTCPIMRDTATVPCWLAEYMGERYYLVTQEDAEAAIYPPSLGHQALIEGTPTDQTRCGGKVLTNLHISIRPDRDPSCDAILPATDAFQITDLTRGPGPAKERPAAGEAAAGGAAAGGAAATPRPPLTAELSGSQRFEVLYDFDWQTAGRQIRIIQEAAAYARASPRANVHVTGFRASVRLADNRVLTEEESIGLRRARELVEALVALGVPRAAILVADDPEAEMGDHTRRRATIDVVMSGGVEDHSEH